MRLILLAALMVTSFNVQSVDWDTVVPTTLGAVAGGVVGYQFGGGTGQYVATAVGSLAGAAIGNNIAGGDGFGFREEELYQPEFNNQGVYIGEDDWYVKQQMSYQAQRRNAIRNGEQW